MQGMSNTTGQHLDGLSHLRQSIQDILLTPIGSRPMLRDYGSRLFELIDAPLNAETRLEIHAAVVDALQKWEPRIQVQRVDVVNAGAGTFELNLIAMYLPDGKQITMEGITA